MSERPVFLREYSAGMYAIGPNNNNNDNNDNIYYDYKYYY